MYLFDYNLGGSVPEKSRRISLHCPGSKFQRDGKSFPSLANKAFSFPPFLLFAKRWARKVPRSFPSFFRPPPKESSHRGRFVTVTNFKVPLLPLSSHSHLPFSSSPLLFLLSPPSFPTRRRKSCQQRSGGGGWRDRRANPPMRSQRHSCGSNLDFPA